MYVDALLMLRRCVQKFVSSAYSEPFNTLQGLLDSSVMTGRASDDVSDDDVVESQASGVDPLWIVLPLCVAIIAVLLFVVVVIVLRCVSSNAMQRTQRTQRNESS